MINSKISFGFIFIMTCVCLATALTGVIIYRDYLNDWEFFSTLKSVYFLFMIAGLYAYYLALKTPFFISLQGDKLIIRNLFKTYSFSLNGQTVVTEDSEFTKLPNVRFHRLSFQNKKYSIGFSDFSIRNYKELKEAIFHQINTSDNPI